MKKILQIVSCLELGGTEAFIMNNYRALDRSKYQFDFAVFVEKDYPYLDEISKLGGNVYFLGTPSLKNAHKFIKRFKEVVDEGGPYVAVHSHVNIDNAIPLYAAHLCNIPIRVSHSHDTSGKDVKLIKQLWVSFKTNLIKKYATAFLGCSKEAGEYLYGEKFFSKKGIVIPNGIAVKSFFDERASAVKALKEEFTINENCPLVIGNISRFEEKKNSLFTVNVFGKILNVIPEAVLIMGGSDGGLLEECKSQVEKLGIEKSVRFIGKRTDVPACLKLFDIYLFPSLFEGLPIALLEAQASGCFCVASDGVSPEVDRGLNSVHFISLKKNETEWAKEIIESYNNWKEPEQKVILKKYIESGFEINEAHKKLMRIYNGK